MENNKNEIVANINDACSHVCSLPHDIVQNFSLAFLFSVNIQRISSTFSLALVSSEAEKTIKQRTELK